MKRSITRVISLLLVAALLCGFAVPVQAVHDHSDGMQSLEFREVDGNASLDKQGLAQDREVEEPQFADTDMVRVSIILERESTIQAGFSTTDIARNQEAMSYRQELEAEQISVTGKIEAAIGGELDVAWNLTLAANLISANIPYGQIETIAALPGVREVVQENWYEPMVVDTDETAEPNTSTSPVMIGSTAAYAAGYTGAGTRIAVIDTGIDTDHQSFSAAGFAYSLKEQAAAADKSEAQYVESLDLLDTQEISRLLSQLNISGVSAESLYLNAKLPFAYNYVDSNLDVTHDNDTQGEHGSHVAGIAAANAYIPNEDGTFSNALTTVLAQGVAPDAQIITMKVFGKGGGAHDSDYMAAIEDAIVLGADSINLSLGTVNPGFSRNTAYQELLDGLTEHGAVVTISAGNYGSWAENAVEGIGYLHSDDVSMDTVGDPASVANSLSVASVDNVGFTGAFLQIGDDLVFYTQNTSYQNAPMNSLAGEHAYILIDGIGTEEEFAALSEVLEGKIAVCSRGSISFFQKANAAISNGAIATIIYNNEPGLINMDLTGYSYTAPCVSITQEEGALLRAAAAAVTDEETGEVLYYQGSMTVGAENISTVYDQEYYTMSSFSSWGVPGSLLLKPEITAPGGNIYSVNGAEPGGSAYESMSGTSMAAPQVAGMAALIAQHIQAEALDTKTGLSARQLSQSLLMSTAAPLCQEDNDGYYYSVLEQGAGLANVGSVIAAGSYILMDENATDSYADGKVKVELGDDPDRTGIYSFSFTLNNLTDSERTYTLGSDFFTQDVFSYEGEDYLDTLTAPVAANVTYLVNGEIFVPTAPFHCDLDGDGDTDADDAQVILDYLVGARTAVDAELADVDGDGSVTTYDAYLILKSLETAAVTLPANGTVSVTVRVEYPESVRDYLDATYPNGAYTEGYVFVYPVSTAEGELTDVTHSIPVLGFYGNWSDASMFDRTSYTAQLYGDVSVPYTGVTETNNLVIKHNGDTASYYQIGNPYLVEDTYPEGKAAISSADTLYQYKATLIRNAAAMAAVITDEDGDILHIGNVTNQEDAAFYYTQGAAWRNTITSCPINKMVKSLGISEGDVIRVSLVAVPEYYEDGADFTAEELEALLQSGVLGGGAFLTTTLRVDDTAPEMLRVSKDLTTGDLTITGVDNQYIAAVAVLNSKGSAVYATSSVEQAEAGQEASVVLELGDAGIGTTCVVMLADYAGNERYYTVEYGGEPIDYTGKMYGFTNMNYRGSGNRCFEIDPDTLYYNSASDYGGTTNVAQMDVSVTAAEYVDGYVFMAASDGNFYVAEQGEWSDYGLIASYTDTTEKVYAMAFNYMDGQLYVLGTGNTVYTMNLSSGALTKAYTVSIVHPRSKDSLFSTDYLRLNTLAIDDSGNFYATNYANGPFVYLYTWTSAKVVDGAISNLTAINQRTDYAGYMGQYSYDGASLAWDHDKDILYFATMASYNIYAGNNFTQLVICNTTTGQTVKANTSSTSGSRLYVSTAGLYIVPSGSSYVTPEEEAIRIVLNQTEKTLLHGAVLELTAEVYPWNLGDKSVTWTSSDESVATVDGGTVTARGAGKAVITATTNAAPNLTATCEITVNPLPAISFSGLVRDADGNSYWSDITTESPAAWTAVSEKTDRFLSGTLCDSMLYVHNGSSMYGFDPDTFEWTSYGEINTTWLWSDAAAAPATEDGLFGKVIGLCNDGTYLEMIDPEAGTLTYFDVSSSYRKDPMAAIAHAGSGTYDYIGACPANFYYMLTESGELWQFILLTYNNGVGYTCLRKDLGNVGVQLSGVSSVNGGLYASMIYDADSGCLVLSTYQGGGSTELYIIDPENCVAAKAGDFGDSVYPVVSLYQYDRITALTVLLKASEDSIYVGDSVTMTAKLRPTTYTGGVTWSSDNPAVATVDENGVVTGVSVGTAVITATTVDRNEAGDTVSASCTVTVNPLTEMDLKFQAQVTDAGGTPYWVTVDTASLTYSNATEAATTFTGGGMHDGMLYATDSDFLNNCNIYQINPDEGFAEKKGSNCVYQYAMVDATQAPADIFRATVDGIELEREVFGLPLCLGSMPCLYMLKDYVTGDLSPWYLSASYYDLAAIAYIGAGTDENGAPTRTYLVLGADGTLYHFLITPVFVTTEAGDTVLGYLLTRTVYGNIGTDFKDKTALSMTYVESGEEKGLLIADSSHDAELYYVDLTADTLSCGKVGHVDGATAITAIYTDTEIGTVSIPGAAFRPGTDEQNSSILSCRTGDELMSEHVSTVLETGDAAADVSRTGDDPAAGTLSQLDRAATANVHPSTVQQTGATVGDGYVELTLVENQDVTNGLVTIAFDPACLTFDSINTCLANHAIHVDAETGTIVFCYATAAAVAAGDPLAKLRFTYDTAYLDTGLEVEMRQRNENVAITGETWESAIVYEVGGHDYQVTDYKAPTCFAEGFEVLTCTKCGDSVTNVLPANSDHCVSKAFQDLDIKRWYHEGVDFVLETGLMVGVGGTRFAPNSTMTRAQLVTVLYRLENEPRVDGLKNPFEDVPAGQWYTDAVIWAAGEGIVTGVSATRFAPQTAITREQIAAILYRYSSAERVEVDHLKTYTDGAYVSLYAYDAMNWAVANGLITGVSETKLAPRDTATRAQVATILMRYCKIGS